MRFVLSFSMLMLAGRMVAQQETVLSFSPDGDGHQDSISLRAEALRDVRYQILDNKDHVIFSGNGPGIVWDGTDAHGKPAPAGEYKFVITAVTFDEKIFDKKGKINLTRKAADH